jgi:hypothetical protein
MLRLPTRFSWYVVQIWGRYWTADRAAERIPNIVASKNVLEGWTKRKKREMIKTTRIFVRESIVTRMAVV